MDPNAKSKAAARGAVLAEVIEREQRASWADTTINDDPIDNASPSRSDPATTTTRDTKLAERLKREQEISENLPEGWSIG